ncbi:hypothetical protein ACE10Z_13235 [Bradyrhizobium sp. Pha-3]|uniref:hypothetical protein n=1 Tax=Bradyrhizobium sp. Pha-3 TaxID=208375 RepID=UPI0035D4CCAC
MSWFSKAKRKDIWDDPAAQPLGDIEAAQRIRAFRAINAGSIKAEVLKEHPTLEGEQA